MNDFEFDFEETPWEQFAQQLKPNAVVSAAHVLTLLEGESEDMVEDAFLNLQELGAELDIQDLPKPSLTGDSGLRLRREADLIRDGKLAESLDAGDPLKMYLEELAAVPVCGDVCLLASQLSEANLAGKNCDNLRNTLVELSLSRVVSLAGEHTGWGVLLLDLIQEGSLGLWQATAGFTGNGQDFEAVCDRWIRFYMKKAIMLQARCSGVGQRMRQMLEDYRSVDERLLGDLGRNPTIDEIAEELHITREETMAIAGMLDNVRMMDRVKPAEPQEEAEEDPEDQQAVEDTAYFQMRQRIADLMSGLSEQDAKLLSLRFGLEGGLPLSPEEVGRRLSLTPEEVVAREAKALAQLRNQ